MSKVGSSVAIKPASSEAYCLRGEDRIRGLQDFPWIFNLPNSAQKRLSWTYCVRQPAFTGHPTPCAKTPVPSLHRGHERPPLRSLSPWSLPVISQQTCIRGPLVPCVPGCSRPGALQARGAGTQEQADGSRVRVLTAAPGGSRAQVQIAAWPGSLIDEVKSAEKRKGCRPSQPCSAAPFHTESDTALRGDSLFRVLVPSLLKSLNPLGTEHGGGTETLRDGEKGRNKTKRPVLFHHLQYNPFLSCAHTQKVFGSMFRSNGPNFIVVAF